MDEWIDILEMTGEKTGEVRPKSQVHRDGLWHRCFHCWVVYVPDDNDDIAEPLLILQRRAMQKDTWPGRLDVSVGGHLSAGEDILDGRREMREELGLDVRPEDLIPLAERRVERVIPQGMDREFHGVYLLLSGTHPSQLRLQTEEVDSVVCITLEDAETLAEGQTVPATVYYGDGRRGVGSSVSSSEFVDAGAGAEYLRWVIREVRSKMRNRLAGNGAG